MLNFIACKLFPFNLLRPSLVTIRMYLFCTLVYNRLHVKKKKKTPRKSPATFVGLNIPPARNLNALSPACGRVVDVHCSAGWRICPSRQWCGPGGNRVIPDRGPPQRPAVSKLDYAAWFKFDSRLISMFAPARSCQHELIGRQARYFNHPSDGPRQNERAFLHQ